MYISKLVVREKLIRVIIKWREWMNKSPSFTIPPPSSSYHILLAVPVFLLSHSPPSSPCLLRSSPHSPSLLLLLFIQCFPIPILLLLLIFPRYPHQLLLLDIFLLNFLLFLFLASCLSPARSLSFSSSSFSSSVSIFVT